MLNSDEIVDSDKNYGIIDVFLVYLVQNWIVLHQFESSVTVVFIKYNKKCKHAHVQGY